MNAPTWKSRCIYMHRRSLRIGVRSSNYDERSVLACNFISRVVYRTSTKFFSWLHFFVGWWGNRGFRISYWKGNPFLGGQGNLITYMYWSFFLLFFLLFPCHFTVLICHWIIYIFIEYTWQLGMNFEFIRSNSTILHVFPFNSEKKRGGVMLKQVIIWWKHFWFNFSFFDHIYIIWNVFKIRSFWIWSVVLSAFLPSLMN